MKHIVLFLLLVPMLMQAQPQSNASILNGTGKFLRSTGWPAPPTPIGGETSGSISATNLGVVAWRLLSIRIVAIGAGTGFSEFDLIDASGNRVKFDPVDTLLAPGGRHIETVVFHPDHVGVDSVAAEFVFDSAGLTRDTIRTMLYGEGIMSVVKIITTNPDPASPGPGLYVEPIAASLGVPVRLEFDSNPLIASIRRITFAIEFLRDAVQIRTPPFSPATGILGFGSGPFSEFPTHDSVFVDVSMNQPMTSGSPIGTLNVQVMLSRDTMTQFIVKNVTYFDGQNNPIPGITTTIEPGTLIIEEVCPSALIRQLLISGSVHTTGITPNPSAIGGGATLHYHTSDATTPISVAIFNDLGLQVKEIMPLTDIQSGDHQLPFDTRDLVGGTYTIRIMTPATSIDERFVLYR